MFIFCLFIYFLLYYLASLIETFNASASECLGIILMIRKTYNDHEPGAKTSDGSRPRAEGRGEGGGGLFYLPRRLFFLLWFLLFLSNIRGREAGPPDPSTRSATEDDFCLFKIRLHLQCILKSGKWIPSTKLHIGEASLIKPHARDLKLHSLRSSDGTRVALSWCQHKNSRWIIKRVDTLGCRLPCLTETVAVLDFIISVSDLLFRLLNPRFDLWLSTQEGDFHLSRLLQEQLDKFDWGPAICNYSNRRNLFV